MAIPIDYLLSHLFPKVAFYSRVEEQYKENEKDAPNNKFGSILSLL